MFARDYTGWKRQTDCITLIITDDISEKWSSKIKRRGVSLASRDKAQ